MSRKNVVSAVIVRKPQGPVPVDVDYVLRGWHTLSSAICGIHSIKDCMYLLKYEIDHNNRPQLTDRLCARIASLSRVQVRQDLDKYVRSERRAAIEAKIKTQKA